MEKCKPADHKFVFQYVGYTHSDYTSAGGSGRDRTYVDVYFCEKCLRQERRNPRVNGNQYAAPVPGSVPL